MPSRNTTAQAIIREIEKQAGRIVTVNWDNLDPDRAVVLSDATLSAEEALDQMLSGTGYTWEPIHGHIVIGKSMTPDDGRNAVSAMRRNDFSQMQLKFVPDPWSRTQQPFDSIVNSRIVRMSNENGQDSTGMVVANFRVNSSTLERDYMDNARALDILDGAFKDRNVISTMDYMVITAGSSPDGNEAVNEELAARRALALKSYVMWKFPSTNRDMIYTFSIGEDWTGLQWLVENDPDTPDRSEVLDILESQQSSSSKKAALKRLGNGRSWTYMTQHMLSKLRGGAALSLYTKVAPKKNVVVEETTPDTVYVEPVSKPQPVKIVELREAVELVKRPLFALKTNLLFDALTALNVELEVPIGKRWSMAGEWIFPFWEFDPKHVIETKTGILEARLWPGNRTEKPKLTGWFMGLYGGGGSFDFGWGDTGRQSKQYWMGGVSGGYAHTISKNGNWRMEYSLGVGYMHTKYSEYKPTLGVEGDWHLIRRRDGINRWIGPTRAKVSFVWMINGNFKQEGSSE
jgi:hypothetical protein